MNKVKRIKMIFTMCDVFKNSYYNNNHDNNRIDNLYIVNNFISNTFSKNYKYFNKKLNIIATKNFLT